MALAPTLPVKLSNDKLSPDAVVLYTRNVTAAEAAQVLVLEVVVVVVVVVVVGAYVVVTICWKLFALTAATW